MAKKILYIVRPGDSISAIAQKFGSTIQAILSANVICDPNRIFVETPLIIPEEGVDVPKAGGKPYYVVQPGDTLECLASQFNITTEHLIKTNQLFNQALIMPGTELLILLEQPEPNQLYQLWNRMGGAATCDLMNPLLIHGVYYIGSFYWESLSDVAIPYLSQLIKHPCDPVRQYAAISLGRIATAKAHDVLNVAIHDRDPHVSEMARLALLRTQIVQQYRSKRYHVTTNDHLILDTPESSSATTKVPKGTALITLRWNIPSPTQEEGPIGDIQLFDYVQIVQSGKIGFMPRVGHNAIWMI
ncbi:LysM peptidoglycan-binding domain-containing protein [Desertibacillus haloalkaliphilus]|uniref:LysM peptidoglycan-binding domain-containing protein n=1 Tax=Desertibacillus haloalkaliphilus TaxID=1328930 RepID=UPI001C26369F|nr:LysM peptidoglycan-binding domain-containing protein [Desertibacillus haloalkaliphilus]MBU8907495.1 LysM peptidoglycan-binding domain-containing protein [Desertibacillus haloalkaliphilus]